MFGCGASNFLLDFCVYICCMCLFVCCFVFAGEGEMRSATLGRDVASHLWPGCARSYLAGMYSATSGQDCVFFYVICSLSFCLCIYLRFWLVWGDHLWR